MRGRQSGDRWRGTRHRDGIQAPLRQLDTAVAGGGAWVTPAVVCPPTCSVVVRQQVGPGLGGWQGADAPLHPFAVPPPPFTPSQMPLRRSSPHLTAASQRTQALTDHFFFLPLISAAVSCRKPQVRGLLVFLFVLFLGGRDRPVGDQSLVPLTALQPKLQSVRRGMSHSAHDSRT